MWKHNEDRIHENSLANTNLPTCLTKQPLWIFKIFSYFHFLLFQNCLIVTVLTKSVSMEHRASFTFFSSSIKYLQFEWQTNWKFSVSDFLDTFNGIGVWRRKRENSRQSNGIQTSLALWSRRLVLFLLV